MTYILVNSSELIQTQFETNNVDDIEREFFGRTSHDIELLSSMQLSEHACSIYERYTIYKIIHSPVSHYPIITEIIRYDMKTNEFKHNLINRTHVEHTQSQQSSDTFKKDIKKMTEQQNIKHMHDIPCSVDRDEQYDHRNPSKHMIPKLHKCVEHSDHSHSDVFGMHNDSESDLDDYMNQECSSNDENALDCDTKESDNEWCRSTNSDDENKCRDRHNKKTSVQQTSDDENATLSEVKKELDSLTEQQDEKLKQLQEREKENVDKLCEIKTQKNDIEYDEQKKNECVKKFNADCETYKRLKQDLSDLSNTTDPIDPSIVKRVPPFFINTFLILRQMDNLHELDTQNAATIFFEKYLDFLKNNIGNVEEQDDPYGLMKYIS